MSKQFETINTRVSADMHQDKMGMISFILAENEHNLT